MLESRLLKGDSKTDVSCEYGEIFKGTYFEEQLRMAAFVSRTRVHFMAPP